MALYRWMAIKKGKKMRQHKKYNKRDIERMLRAPGGQAILKALDERELFLQMGWPGEEIRSGSAQRILKEIKASARQEAARIQAEKAGRMQKKKKKAARRAARKNQHGYHRPLYRRGLALTCGFIVLLTSFLLFAPAGRAFTLQVRQAIIRLFGNRATVEIAEPDYVARTYDQSIAEKYASTLDEATNSETSSESSSQEFSCIEDFTKETGYVPYVVDANDYTIESITYSSSPHYGNSLIIQYRCSMGGTLISTQIWELSTDITTLSDDGFQDYLAQRGNIIYYSIDKIDKSFYGVTILEDSVLYIGADSSIPPESILALF